MAPLARDRCADRAVRSVTRRARGDERPDGIFGCLDRLRAAAALSGAFWQHGSLGNESARRSAVGRAADVGAGVAAVSRSGALAGLVEFAGGRVARMTTLLKFIHLAT